MMALVCLLGAVLADFTLGALNLGVFACVLPAFVLYRLVYHHQEEGPFFAVLAVLLLAIQDLAHFGRVGPFFFYGLLLCALLRLMRYFFLEARLATYAVLLSLYSIVIVAGIQGFLLHLPWGGRLLARSVCAALLMGLIFLVLERFRASYTR